MPAALPEALSRIALSGRISADDVLAIRRIIYADGEISTDEAEWLFALNDAVTDQTPEWHRLFIEALTDYVVHQAEPHGYVSDENVAWLISRITRGGYVQTDTELELLINALEKAIVAPDPLAIYAMQEVKAFVLRSNRISEREVSLLKRVLYAAGGQQSIAITREEAEVLYDIHDARAGAEDDPAWIDLFAKALLNHLMFASGFAPPTREEALRREAWLNDTSADPTRFMGNMVNSLRDLIVNYRSSEIVRVYSAPDVMEDYVNRRTAIQLEAETITDEEAAWLSARLTGNGVYSGAERALVEALRAEQPRLHPAIEAALAKIS